MVSHDLQKGFAMCTHALVLAKGRVVSFDEKDALDFDEFTTLYRPTVGMGVAYMAVELKKPSTWRQYKTLLRKDLEQEFRTKEMLTSMGIYAPVGHGGVWRGACADHAAPLTCCR